MTKQEKIFLGLMVIALVAIVIWQRHEKPANTEIGANDPTSFDSFTPTSRDMAKGPQWLMANEPWGFMPPIHNFLPTVTIGQEGQVVQNPLNFVKRAGVFIKGKLTNGDE